MSQLIYGSFITPITEPYEVSFERTLYEVNEGTGLVEICVNLTQPAFDIRDNEVGVEVFEHSILRTNEHIPSNGVIAGNFC